RKDDDSVSAGFHLARSRQNDGHDRHHRIPSGRSRNSGGEHHAGVARSLPAIRGVGTDGRHVRHHGGFFARAYARPRLRHAFPYGRVHQSHARSSRFPPHHG